MQALDTGRAKPISCKIHEVQQHTFNVPLSRSHSYTSHSYHKLSIVHKPQLPQKKKRKKEMNFFTSLGLQHRNEKCATAIFTCVPRLQQSSVSLYFCSTMYAKRLDMLQTYRHADSTIAMRYINGVDSMTLSPNAAAFTSSHLTINLILSLETCSIKTSPVNDN